MASVAVTPRISVAEYLATTYRPDCDYIDGELEERALGETLHSGLQQADVHRRRGAGRAQGMATEHGNQPQQIIAAAKERVLSQAQPGLHTDARETVAFAGEKVFEREAVADERLIMREALRRGMGEVSFAETQAEFERRRRLWRERVSGNQPRVCHQGPPSIYRLEQGTGNLEPGYGNHHEDGTGRLTILMDGKEKRSVSFDPKSSGSTTMATPPRRVAPKGLPQAESSPL